MTTMSGNLRALLITATVLFNSGYFTSAQTVAAGGNHSIFVCASGEAKVSGWNPNGQFGNGTTTGSFTPIPVIGLQGIVAVAARDEFTLYLLSDSTVWATGSNGSGQFGNSTSTSSNTLVQIPNLTGVTKIAAGFYHSLFLKSDGTVWSCGRNFSGELGDGTQTQRTTPVQVTSLTGVIDIAAGDYHSMFLSSDSTVWSCGDNQNGSLGLGAASPIQVLNPTQVTSLSGVKSIAGGFRHSLFVKHDGTAWASGYNNDGQLGNGTNVSAPIPVQVNNLTSVVGVSAGQYHSLFLKGDGTVWSTGNNLYGQLGNGTNTNQNIPVPVSGLTDVTKVAASGYYHSLFLKDDNTFWACGQNNVGQLGNGTVITTTIPVLVLDSCSIISSIAEVGNNIQAVIYPNPSDGLFNMDVSGFLADSYIIKIYNLQGEMVYRKTLLSSNNVIDLSDKSAGLYFYKIIDSKDVIKAGKIIVN
jgi:alpha-tubulin suppressor-like RCC1 family protein